jgi:hypothetical protein
MRISCIDNKYFGSAAWLCGYPPTILRAGGTPQVVRRAEDCLWTNVPPLFSLARHCFSTTYTLATKVETYLAEFHLTKIFLWSSGVDPSFSAPEHDTAESMLFVRQSEAEV